MKYQESDVYFFSDQDDVWLPEKVEMQLEEAIKHDTSQPLLVYTDLKVVDQKINPHFYIKLGFNIKRYA